ncbi:MAG: S49 family peptidase [Gammaproteobacteria bacterium]
MNDADTRQEAKKLEAVASMMAETVNKMTTIIDSEQKLRGKELNVKWRKTLLWIAFMLGPILAFHLYQKWLERSPAGGHVAVIKVEGPIVSDSFASAAHLIPGIKEAFNDKKAKGVIIHVSSPGGSPVQSEYLRREFSHHAKNYDRPVITVCEEACVSGGYWIAAAGQEIYVADASIIGSIGVVSESFAFDLSKFAEQFGIERRVITAGEFKRRGSPFEPLKEEDKQKTETLLAQVHNQFKAVVSKSRGERLTEDVVVWGSGDYWTGTQAVTIGLADGIGSLHDVIRDRFDVADMVDYTPHKRFAQSLKGFGISVISAILEPQLWW